MGCCTGQVGAA